MAETPEDLAGVPIGVVLPKTVDDVVATVALARKFGAPILARGGGTSLAGQCCNVAVVLDMSKYMNHVVELDPHQGRARRRAAEVHAGLERDVERRPACRLACSRDRLGLGMRPAAGLRRVRAASGRLPSRRSSAPPR